MLCIIFFLPLWVVSVGGWWKQREPDAWFSSLGDQDHGDSHVIWTQPVTAPPGIVTWSETSQWDPLLRFCTINQQCKNWRKTWELFIKWMLRGCGCGSCIPVLWDSCEISEPIPQYLHYKSLCWFWTIDLCWWPTRTLKCSIPNGPLLKQSDHKPDLPHSLLTHSECHLRTGMSCA